MLPNNEDLQARGQVLAATIRAVRRHRRMTVGATAKTMNMALRTYQNFEAGVGRIHLETIDQFAQATDSDPIGVIAAILLGSPTLAVRCADNKLMTTILMAVDDFNEASGEAVASVKPQAALCALRETFADLTGAAAARDAAAGDWVGDLAARFRGRMVKATGSD